MDGLPVPNSGWDQLELFLWAIPLFFWGVIFAGLWEEVQLGKAKAWKSLGWALFGALFIGGYAQNIQSQVLDICRLGGN